MSDNNYILYVGKLQVSVSGEVYKAYFNELDRERYIKKLSDRHEVHAEEYLNNLPEAFTARSMEEALIESELARMLYSALARLPESERKLIHELYFENKSLRDIADESGIHFMTIQSRKRRILEKLRKFLENS